MKKRKVNIQTYIAVCSFVVAVVLSFMGFYTPPKGDLTEANLYLVAQFLLVTTSIFGVSSIVSKQRIHIPSVDEEKNGENL